MWKFANKEVLLLLACMVLAAWLRFDGLTRGTSDFVLPEQTQVGVETVFYNFHPDEETLVRAVLRLDNPLEPPLTAYGLLPMYLLRAVLEAACWGAGREGLDIDSLVDRPFIFTVARVTAALLSWVSVWLVWGLGRRFFCGPVALLAAYFMAVAPVAVQQAHFYTVDGVFTFCALVFFCVALSAVSTSHRGLYVLAGALVGATGAVRLNGLLLGLVLVAGHILVAAEGAHRPFVRRSLRRSELWLAGAAAVLVLIVLQPYLIVEPALLGRSAGTDDFAYSVEIARGGILRPWSLVDVHTMPYLHYWTHLWPLGVGWPLTLVFGAALIYGIWQRQWVGRMFIVWVFLAFVSVGALHTKHVRYLLPLLPFLSLVGAEMLWRLAQRWQRSGYVVLAAVVLPAGAYGIAFAGIYPVEDSRIQAGRWIAENVPTGSVIGVESGGFSLRSVISSARHRENIIPVSTLFGTRGYLLCEATRRHLYSQLGAVDYIAIAGVNRHQQFTAVPEMYPAVADFYDKLVAGKLGFALQRRFTTYPSLGEWELEDYGAEPSFVGYDHPTVWIFRRTDDFASAWEHWGRELAKNSHCGDAAAVAVAAHVGAAAWSTALDKAVAARQADSNLRFLAFVEAHIYGLQGDVERQRDAVASFKQGLTDGSLSAYLLPWATCLSLMQLGLDDLALDALQESARIIFPDKYIHRMAENSLHVADLFLKRGDAERTAAAYRISMRIEPQAKVATALGNMAQKIGQDKEALEWWEQSLQLDQGQLALRKRVGQHAFELGHYDRGLDHLGQAVQTDPDLTQEQRIRDFNLLARTAQQAQLKTWARAFWKYSLRLDSTQENVRRQLEHLEADGKHP